MLLVTSCSRPEVVQTGPVARPNVVVILTDDQGYGDISLNPDHAFDVSTPNMDALAADGIRFSQAYTSGQTCSPTRAGLMLGRYQHRVGVYSKADGGRGFDPAVPIFPTFLPDEYVSTVIGKWHLGLDDDYPELKWHASNRGFDEAYTFMGRGGRDYFDLRLGSDGEFAQPLYRNTERIGDEGYLTNRLTEEAIDFIDRNKSDPFFLYLAYNAVHAPPQAPQEGIDRFRERYPDSEIERVVLMAMLEHLDNGVGEVVEKLKQEDLFDDTILFFLTDNGGSRSMRADNSPLRGFKGSFYEGGIRTPLIVSWPAKFAGGGTVDTPVISLDILPTALDAVGELPSPADFDGRSMLSLLTGEVDEHHDALYWSDGGRTGEWAIRRGEWKLSAHEEDRELYRLDSDPAEEFDLATRYPRLVVELEAEHNAWLDQMADPITGGERRWVVEPEVGMTRKERKKSRRARELRRERRSSRKEAKRIGSADE